MLIIGLTGGIGSGKSTVADLFRAHGVPIIDADQIGRELVEPGQPALAEIVALFGPDMLTIEGRLDRSRLRARVLCDASQRQRLEHILHPRILTEMQRRASRLTAKYCIFAIPLLLETGQDAWVDRVLVVDAPDPVRRQRLRERDGLDEAQIDAFFAAQLGREQRLTAADDIIVNDSNLTALQTQVDALHGRYMVLADSGDRRRRTGATQDGGHGEPGV